MSAARVARFPGAAGRIPNFTGAEAAAQRLRGLPEWRRARTLKANPDSAQLPVRQRALAGAAGLIGPGTVAVTTVHELQLQPAGTIPLAEHDVPVDLVITPDRLIDCRGRHGPRPAAGIRWPELTPAKIAAIPLLAAQHAGHQAR
jgi:5-formyltetrahydrofolate cyclo-ligase